jgi:hypothetical protein
MDTTFSLDATQRATLDELTAGGSRDFWRGYDFVESERESGRLTLDDGTAYWFLLATRINRNDRESLANRFMRTFTQSGLGGQVDDMQAISDAIGRAVIADLLRGEPIGMTRMVEDDIGVAIAQFNVTIGGWGGSFYYWNLVYGPAGLTIGEQIVGDASERTKFVRALTDATVAVVEAFAADPSHADLTGAEDAAWKGLENVPPILRDEVKARALEGLLRDSTGGLARRGLVLTEELVNRIHLGIEWLLGRSTSR